MVRGLDYYHVIDHIARHLLLEPSKVILPILWLFKKKQFYQAIRPAITPP
jgi:hypothetical protein